MKDFSESKILLEQFSNGPAIEVYFSVQKEALTAIQLNPSTTMGLKWGLFDTAAIKPALHMALDSWLRDYINRRPTSDFLPLLWISTPTPFIRKVLESLYYIPFGNRITYKQLARSLGNEKASRAVGLACGKNPFPLLYPCHRVVASTGKLQGFAFGLEVKKRLLEFENPAK